MRELVAVGRRPRGIGRGCVRLAQVVHTEVDEDVWAAGYTDRGRDQVVGSEADRWREVRRATVPLHGCRKRLECRRQRRREDEQVIEAHHDPALRDDLDHVLQVAVLEIARSAHQRARDRRAHRRHVVGMTVEANAAVRLVVTTASLSRIENRERQREIDRCAQREGGGARRRGSAHGSPARTVVLPRDRVASALRGCARPHRSGRGRAARCS